MHCVENNRNSNDRKRKQNRKKIWFNPPFRKTVKINSGKDFLYLLSKHFPKNYTKCTKFITAIQLKSVISACKILVP